MLAGCHLAGPADENLQGFRVFGSARRGLPTHACYSQNMGSGWSKDVAKEVMSGLVAMAMAGAQALVEELPLGDAVVGLGKQLHAHLLQFKENDANAVLFGRRIAGLTETVELAVRHIGADKEQLPQSLAAVADTLVQAIGFVVALKNVSEV